MDLNSMGELLQIEKEEPDHEQEGGAGWCLGVKENGQRGTSCFSPLFVTAHTRHSLGWARTEDLSIVSD